MRLDKYLKVSRLIKRRTVANEVADAGRILINGKVAKASQAVNAVFEALSKAMSEGEKITISGFGTFEMRERAERQGINPRTREPITIAASRSIVFKPGKSLKDTL